jgi:type IV pilus assembly protein PilB
MRYYKENIMTIHFDTDAEDAKLALLREREEEDLTRVLSEKYDIPYTDLSVIPINMDALRVLPKARAKECGAVVYDKNGKHLSLAVRNLQNEYLLGLEKELSEQGFVVEKFLISERSLARGLERYEDLSLATKSTVGVFDIPDKELAELTPFLSTLSTLRSFLTETLSVKNTAQVSRIFEAMLAGALSLKASDIHLEPGDGLVRLRLRLDGVLTDVLSLDEHIYHLILSRIKVLSGAKLNITDRAQDGRFTVHIKNTDIEIRTSIIPGNYGESLVLRVLDPSAIHHSFLSMGMHPKLLERIAKEIRRPNGMLLTTGPTGSGKTTTLYTFLQEVHTPEIKVVTIEDPIEYHLEGIVQTQTNGKDYTFASGLRSVLRQDPDVIMVGEIRDNEVAEVAVQAALTGHFVFSTLHTNNAAGSFPRLVDLGVDPKTFSSAVSVAMGQRLVRTLDKAKSVQRPTTQEEKTIMKKIFASLSDVSLMPESFDSVWGPDTSIQGHENESFYKGRTGLHEAIFMDEELGNFLRSNPSAGEIERETRRQGYLTMAQDGVIKAIEGITSLEEVFSVVDLPRD